MSTLDSFLHITREDGEVVEVSKELVIAGPVAIFVGGAPVGYSDGYTVNLPLWRKEGHEPR